MTIYDDPNREAVGLDPIWTGAGEEPTPVEPPSEETDLPTSFDPGEHTVSEVEEYVNEHPDERERILDAERDGKSRVTLVDWLGTDAG